MHVEHIDPAGGDHPDNLALSCATCNLSKAAATAAIDPETAERHALYNPRTQAWNDHFSWTADGEYVLGLTPIGRATVSRLKINQPRIVRARRNWKLAGLHPPNL